MAAHVDGRGRRIAAAEVESVGGTRIDGPFDGLAAVLRRASDLQASLRRSPGVIGGEQKQNRCDDLRSVGQCT
jgi:hypothetical protein